MNLTKLRFYAIMDDFFLFDSLHLKFGGTETGSGKEEAGDLNLYPL